MQIFKSLFMTFLLSQSPLLYSAEFDAERTKAEVMGVLDEFILTFSAKDPKTHVATYHFPHYRLAQGKMSSWDTSMDAIEMHKMIFIQLQRSGWDKSVWKKREIVKMTRQKAHVNTQFSRLRKDGSEIGTYDSLYILIKKDGRWAIKMRSSFL